MTDEEPKILKLYCPKPFQTFRENDENSSVTVWVILQTNQARKKIISLAEVVIVSSIFVPVCLHRMESHRLFIWPAVPLAPLLLWRILCWYGVTHCLRSTDREVNPERLLLGACIDAVIFQSCRSPTSRNWKSPYNSCATIQHQRLLWNESWQLAPTPSCRFCVAAKRCLASFLSVLEPVFFAWTLLVQRQEQFSFSSVLWHCHFGDRKGIRHTKPVPLYLLRKVLLFKTWRKKPRRNELALVRLDGGNLVTRAILFDLALIYGCGWTVAWVDPFPV